MGADITSRGDRGRTCLHECIHYLFRASNRVEYEAIRYLVSQGADPRAINNDGLSVSDYAYEMFTTYRIEIKESSYVGDLWDSVLQSCGYDIADFRCVHRQRKARYVDRFRGWKDRYNYGRSNFEELWRGREQFCPYWDDEPWPRADEQDTSDSCSRCQVCGFRCNENVSDSESGAESEGDSDAETDSNQGGALLAETFNDEEV